MTIKEYVKLEKEKLRDAVQRSGQAPKLTIYQFGDLEASNRYVRNKMRDCAEIGIEAGLIKHITVPEEGISFLMPDNPYIVQLPLPEGCGSVFGQMDARLDVDGFGRDSIHTPCTPGGIMDWFKTCGFEPRGKFCVVIGRSEIVGKPMAKLLQEADATVAMVHTKTPEDVKLKLLGMADLVVCAAGVRGVLDCSMCKDDALIVDVGINFDENGKLCGDVVGIPKEGQFVTPVPGGVGLLTRLKLMKNVLDAYGIKYGD